MISERKNSRFTEHPKLLNPLSPNNKKELIGINSIKEENVEDSITFRDCCENVDYDEKNKLENNISNEEGEHSTSGCSKSQISSTKSNNSTSEACKIFNKDDNTPIENDDLFKITPHFINEASLNKNIQLNFNINNNNKNKDKKKKYSRPLTPNLNIIRKFSAPICQSKENKILLRINNDKGYLINEYQKSINNNIENNNKKKENDLNEIKDNDINYNINITKRLSQDVIKTDSSIKKTSFSCAKKKILKNCNDINTSVNENNFIQNNYINKKNPIKNCIYNSLNNPDLNYNNKNPYSFNSNRSMQSKNKKNKNSNLIPRQKTQRKNSSIFSRKNTNTSMNKSLSKKKNNRNISKQKNKNGTISNNGLKTFKSENKINVVHSKVNSEINNLFNGLSDKIAKDPEIHNKIESLIKDIKDIQQVVHRKTQTHFRPRKDNNVINCRQKQEKNY